MYIIVSREVWDDGDRNETYCYTAQTERQLEIIKKECREEHRKVVDFEDLEEECALSRHGDNVIVIFEVNDDVLTLEHSDIYEDDGGDNKDDEDEIIVLNGVKYKRV